MVFGLLVGTAMLDALSSGSGSTSTKSNKGNEMKKHTQKQTNKQTNYN